VEARGVSGVSGGRVGRFGAEPSPTSEDLARFLSAARSRGSATQVRSIRQLVARSGFACATFAAAFSISLAIFPHETRAIAFLFSSPHLSPQAHEENQMRSLKSIGQKSLGVLSSLAIAAGASAQDAVQWRVEDGGNGHWYRIVVRPYGPYNWNMTRADAQAVGGDLASFEAPAEWGFIRSRCRLLPDGTVTQFLAGGRRQPGVKSPWVWLTGDPFSYFAWNVGVPNNGTGENFVLCVGSGTGGPSDFDGWDDWRTDDLSSGYIIEWSADCNSDGIVDYGQIRAGELEDANGNNVPDCCEQSTSCEPCAADIDGSGTVNAVDLAAILTVWGTDGGKYPRADINGDGEVNGPDLAAVLSSWGACP
jgi:hypothetical protein